MKEEGDCSSKRLRPHDITTFQSIIPDWASLPPELVHGIADCVLSTTGGVDAYMDMRAVCHSWHFAIPSLRSAIAKASPLSAVTDLRFRPRNWVMVDLKSGNHDNGERLFLHALTGCFRRLRLPVLRDHLVLGASDGLIVLRDRGPPDLPRVLNPLTGDMLHFAAPLWELLGSYDAECDMYTALTGGPNPTLAVWRDLGWRRHTVIYAHPTSQEFKEEEAETTMTTMTTMVTFQGNIYYADFKGWVFEFVPPAEQCDVQFVVIAQMPLHMDIYLERDDTSSSYLVESTGELLLVRQFGQALKVFRVDVKHKLLEEVKSIGGSRALFLGDERCVSVDSDKLPSVDGDCIYMYRRRAMRMYNLRDDTMEIISNEPSCWGFLANNHPVQSFHENPWFYHTSTSSADDHHPGPLSLIQGMLLRKDLYTKSGLTGLLMDGGGSSTGAINIGTFVLQIMADLQFPEC